MKKKHILYSPDATHQIGTSQARYKHNNKNNNNKNNTQTYLFVYGHLKPLALAPSRVLENPHS